MRDIGDQCGFSSSWEDSVSDLVLLRKMLRSKVRTLKEEAQTGQKVRSGPYQERTAVRVAKSVHWSADLEPLCLCTAVYESMGLSHVFERLANNLSHCLHLLHPFILGLQDLAAEILLEDEQVQ